MASGTPETIGGRQDAETQITFTIYQGSPLPGMGEEHLENGRYRLRSSEATRTLHQLTSWALDNGIELGSLAVERPSLEDIYLELVGEGSE